MRTDQLILSYGLIASGEHTSHLSLRDNYVKQPYRQTLKMNSSDMRWRKRKAESDLSQNPHTIRARKRKELLAQDSINDKIEKAKAADQGAITYARKKLRVTAEYMAASTEKQMELLSSTAEAVKLKRLAVGLFLY
jgi:hypothetical protein